MATLKRKLENEFKVGYPQLRLTDDKLEEYLQRYRKSMIPLINEAKSGTHDDFVNVLMEMYKHMYKCINIRKNVWCEFQDEFQGSFLVQLNSAHTLKEIPSEVIKEFFVLHSSRIAAAGGTIQNKKIKV